MSEIVAIRFMVVPWIQTILGRKAWPQKGVIH